ncbi:hypothetical protein AVEN_119179-1 [Araneus ventricosus]|uniref:Uncharacterized protein n=1 Tax=Araneus ventricosus TaxID=182803 RepID=A0A4Y2SFG2_ARAVE|nr:hypothetical protein AVEN_119179-1 [Araneus ventricosus]
MKSNRSEEKKFVLNFKGYFLIKILSKIGIYWRKLAIGQINIQLAKISQNFLHLKRQTEITAIFSSSPATGRYSQAIEFLAIGELACPLYVTQSLEEEGCEWMGFLLSTSIPTLPFRKLLEPQ